MFPRFSLSHLLRSFWSVHPYFCFARVPSFTFFLLNCSTSSALTEVFVFVAGWGFHARTNHLALKLWTHLSKLFRFWNIPPSELSFLTLPFSGGLVRGWRSYICIYRKTYWHTFFGSSCSLPNLNTCPYTFVGFFLSAFTLHTISCPPTCFFDPPHPL